MRLRYTPRASRQLRGIASYLGERSAPAARTVRLRVAEIAKFLSENPATGRPGALPGTREFVVRGMPYISVYRVEPNDPSTLTILAVCHAQLRPGQEAPEDG